MLFGFLVCVLSKLKFKCRRKFLCSLIVCSFRLYPLDHVYVSVKAVYIVIRVHSTLLKYCWHFRRGFTSKTCNLSFPLNFQAGRWLKKMVIQSYRKFLFQSNNFIMNIFNCRNSKELAMNTCIRDHRYLNIKISGTAKDVILGILSQYGGVSINQ